MSTENSFPSIAHCAMKLIYLHKDWSNKKIAEEVVRIMGSRTGVGNISWYKGKLKKGELKIEDYVDVLSLTDDEKTSTIEIKESEVLEKEFVVPTELIVSEDDIIQASGLQKIALQFIRTRDEKDFNALYLRLTPGMLHYAIGILKDQSQADDCVSIAFSKMWTKLDQYNKYWNFSTWAYGILKNEVMQQIRKNKMTVSLNVNGGKFELSDGIQYEEYRSQSDELSVDPDWSFDETEDLNLIVYEKVLKEINELSPFYRDIMIDRELKGFKYKQISDKYGININSVKTRIKRARLKIIDSNPEYYKLVLARNRKKKPVDIDDDFDEDDFGFENLNNEELEGLTIN